MMNMKHIILTLLLFLGAANLSAQSSWSATNEEQYNSEIRQKLSLDTTLPDYSVYKVDAKEMGPRLAAILQELGAKYKRSDYLSVLSMIQADQIEGLDYCTIEKLGLVNVTKSGNTIIIRFKTTLAQNPLDIKKADLILTFVDGVSENKKVNALFSNICNYIK